MHIADKPVLNSDFFGSLTLGQELPNPFNEAPPAIICCIWCFWFWQRRRR